MVRLRLAVLRWAIEAREESEALWAHPAFGTWLIFLGVATAACLLWWLPSPGIGVATMGIAAALMAARKEPSGRQKVGWTFMTFALLLVEVLAIREDRQEHDAVLNGILAQEVTARSEAKTNFEGIANGIKGTIEQSQKHFDATMAGMKSVLDTTKETKKNTEMTSEGMRAVGAQISLMSNQVRSRTASGDALIAVTRRLTDSLRDFREGWIAETRNIDLSEDQEINYTLRDNLGHTAAERSAAKERWKTRRSDMNMEHMKTLYIALSNAKMLQRLLLDQIAPERQTPEDYDSGPIPTARCRLCVCALHF